jgi:hypothetical protein
VRCVCVWFCSLASLFMLSRLRCRAGGRSLGRAAAGVAPSADALFPLSLCCSSPYLPPRLVAHFWNCFACEERCRHTASAAIDALEWQGPLVPLPVTAILLNVSVGLLDCLLPLGLRVFCRHLEVVGGASPLVLKLSSSRHLKSESQAYPSSAPFRTFACGVIGNATKGVAQAV